MRRVGRAQRLVFDFIRSPRARLGEVGRGDAPRESLFAVGELQRRGWSIRYSDDRWAGWLGRLRTRIVDYLEIPSLGMLRTWSNADTVVVVTRLSAVLALTAKLLGKRLVFADAQGEIPKRRWHRWSCHWALRLADDVICLSHHQRQLWSRTFDVPASKFHVVPYALDEQFFTPGEKAAQISAPRPYFLAVGRDPQRDFSTLLAAAELIDWDVVVVSLPYLIDEALRTSARVRVVQNASYQELKDLYARCSAAVVPIKAGATYMAGIRAAMEGLLLGAPVLATRIPCLEEYFQHEVDLLFFVAEDPDSLAQAALRLGSEPLLRERLRSSARSTMTGSYPLDRYVAAIEHVLESG